MNSITVTANGPYECRGSFEICDAAGTVLASETETWLCRCGRSQNKPYCDGSHEKTGFQSAAFKAVAGAPPADDSATLRIRLRQDGPLRLEGPCEVRAPDGAPLYHGSETALCRCGASANKPFCDGTHRQIGFKTG
jgi:CDGSH-type Zn-finger protein